MALMLASSSELSFVRAMRKRWSVLFREIMSRLRLALIFLAGTGQCWTK